METWPGERYLIRRKVFTFLDSKFHVYAPDGSLLAFSRQKAFKLKEDIRVYGDEAMSQELLLIRARQIIDFSAAYDVVDGRTGTKVGALARKGWSSLFRDSWELRDVNDNVIAPLKEDSALRAALRRFADLSIVMPQRFTAAMGDTPLVTYRQLWNPLVQKLDVTLLPEARDRVDPRLALAAGILLVAVEGRQR